MMSSDGGILLQRVTEALLRLDVRLFGELSRSYREGAGLLGQARQDLSRALSDARVDEKELLSSRFVVLKAISSLRPLLPSSGSRGDRILQVITAIKAVASCFFEFEVMGQPLGETENTRSTFSHRSIILAEYSIDAFEARLEELLETIGEVLREEADASEASVAETRDPLVAGVETGVGSAETHLLRPVIGYLEAIHRYAIPGCVYGTQSRRENPYLAARALRTSCTRLQNLLLSRNAAQEPLERLSRLEGRLTSLIEEVRESGSPLEEAEGWLRRRRSGKLDALRSMCQELMELEQILRDRSPEREP